MRSITNTMVKANSTIAWPRSVRTFFRFAIVRLMSPHSITRIETCRWNVHVTLPPPAEQVEIGSNARPKGVPGIRGLNV